MSSERFAVTGRLLGFQIYVSGILGFGFRDLIWFRLEGFIGFAGLSFLGVLQTSGTGSLRGHMGRGYRFRASKLRFGARIPLNPKP